MSPQHVQKFSIGRHWRHIMLAIPLIVSGIAHPLRAAESPATAPTPTTEVAMPVPAPYSADEISGLILWVKLGAVLAASAAAAAIWIIVLSTRVRRTMEESNDKQLRYFQRDLQALDGQMSKLETAMEALRNSVRAVQTDVEIVRKELKRLAAAPASNGTVSPPQPQVASSPTRAPAEPSRLPAVEQPQRPPVAPAAAANPPIKSNYAPQHNTATVRNDSSPARPARSGPVPRYEERLGVSEDERRIPIACDEPASPRIAEQVDRRQTVLARAADRRGQPELKAIRPEDRDSTIARLVRDDQERLNHLPSGSLDSDLKLIDEIRRFREDLIECGARRRHNTESRTVYLRFRGEPAGLPPPLAGLAGKDAQVEAKHIQFDVAPSPGFLMWLERDAAAQLHDVGVEQSVVEAFLHDGEPLRKRWLHSLNQADPASFDRIKRDLLLQFVRRLLDLRAGQLKAMSLVDRWHLKQWEKVLSFAVASDLNALDPPLELARVRDIADAAELSVQSRYTDTITPANDRQGTYWIVPPLILKRQRPTPSITEFQGIQGERAAENFVQKAVVTLARILHPLDQAQIEEFNRLLEAVDEVLALPLENINQRQNAFIKEVWEPLFEAVASAAERLAPMDALKPWIDSLDGCVCEFRLQIAVDPRNGLDSTPPDSMVVCLRPALSELQTQAPMCKAKAVVVNARPAQVQQM